MTLPYILHKFLATTARRSPDQTAVVFGERSLSYGVLDVLTNQLASVLMTRGVGKGDRVGIYVSKSLASVVSIFAILKTGACYVPLDPKAPVQRLAYIIRDSGITTLLTSTVKAASLRDMFPDNCPLRTVVLVDTDLSRSQLPSSISIPPGVVVVPWQEVIAQPTTLLAENTVVETDTAYVLYT